MGAVASGIQTVRGTPRRKRRHGFSLIEVLMATAIFFLLAGGIFAVVSASNRVTGEIVAAQLEAKRFDAFQRFLRVFFTNLPVDASIELRVRDWRDRGATVELLVDPAPPILPTSDGADESLGIAISGVPDGAGMLGVSVARFSSADGEQQRDEQLNDAEWTLLIPDIRKIRWRFAAVNDLNLSETWEANQGRPGLAELTVERSNGTTDVLAFWIPPVVKQPPTP
jgi:prepilin-type N-terminal cleavage/methylation domain-containing protein